MTTTAVASVPSTDSGEREGWRGFRRAGWRRSIDTRSGIQDNDTPYEGDAQLLTPATARTTALGTRRWAEGKLPYQLEVVPPPSQSLVARVEGQSRSSGLDVV